MLALVGDELMKKIDNAREQKNNEVENKFPIPNKFQEMQKKLFDFSKILG
jgi:hypothetical protein